MRIPTATYRLQFHKDFGFADAKELIGYLRDLGISDVYASPIFKLAPAACMATMSSITAGSMARSAGPMNSTSSPLL
jgi:hypothetical protein